MELICHDVGIVQIVKNFWSRWLKTLFVSQKTWSLWIYEGWYVQ
jgi:hypothetical protein